MGFVYCLALSATQDVHRVFVALGIGVAFLLVAWGIYRYQQYYQQFKVRFWRR